MRKEVFGSAISYQGAYTNGRLHSLIPPSYHQSPPWTTKGRRAEIKVELCNLPRLASPPPHEVPGQAGLTKEPTPTYWQDSQGNCAGGGVSGSRTDSATKLSVDYLQGSVGPTYQ